MSQPGPWPQLPKYFRSSHKTATCHSDPQPQDMWGLQSKTYKRGGDSPLDSRGTGRQASGTTRGRREGETAGRSFAAGSALLLLLLRPPAPQGTPHIIARHWPQPRRGDTRSCSTVTCFPRRRRTTPARALNPGSPSPPRAWITARPGASRAGDPHTQTARAAPGLGPRPAPQGDSGRPLCADGSPSPGAGPRGAHVPSAPRPAGRASPLSAASSGPRAGFLLSTVAKQVLRGRVPRRAAPCAHLAALTHLRPHCAAAFLQSPGAPQRPAAPWR